MTQIFFSISYPNFKIKIHIVPLINVTFQISLMSQVKQPPQKRKLQVNKDSIIKVDRWVLFLLKHTVKGSLKCNG